MTRAEIIKLIGESGISLGGHPMNPLSAYVEDLERFAELVVQAEHQREPVAYLWQHSETARTKIVYRDEIWTNSAGWLLVGPLCLCQPKYPENTSCEVYNQISKPYLINGTGD